MSRGLICALAAGAVALAGCGASGGGADSRDVANVKKVVAAYGRAVADGDGRRACALMTAQGRADVVRSNREFGVRRCNEVATVFRGMATSDQLDELRALRLARVDIHGDRAVGRLVGLRALERSGDTRLRRVGGRWLIDAPRPAD
jgi:hypothetical protein